MTLKLKNNMASNHSFHPESLKILEGLGTKQLKITNIMKFIN